MGILSLAYKWLPKPIINWLGSSQILKPLRDVLLRPGGSDKIKKVKVQWGVNSFYFFAPIKIGVKAKKKGIENTLLRQTLKIIALQNSTELNVLDIGANYGFVSLALCSNLGSIAKVYAFEPHPEICRCIRNSVLDNSFLTIQVENMAVGDVERSVEVNLYGQTSNMRPLHGSPVAVASVWQTTGDAYVNKNDLVPHFIKIDVDGYEYNVLKGLKDTLTRFKPVLVIETNNDIKIVKLLWGSNYKVFDMNFKLVEPGDSLPENIFCFAEEQLPHYTQLLAL